MKKRKVLFITERRADYSRLKPIMQLVQKSTKLELQLVVTGLHLIKEFGETKHVLKQDGFKVDASIPVFTAKDKDDGATMARALSMYIAKITDVVERLKPDLIFCGFDLDAHLAAAIVGMHMNIPVAHIQGGERSGTLDEVLRHAITKFSHIHFVATEESKKRVIRLGEDPKSVFWVVSPSRDTIHSISYPSREAIFETYGLDPKKPLIVFLQHPVTTEVHDVERQIKESIEAIQAVAKKEDAQVLAIYSNNDAGGRRIVSHLKRSGFIVYPHILYEDYLRILKHATVLAGNSSTCIHEAPSFGLPTVNIGTRQQLRERGANVIDVANTKTAIERVLRKAMTDSKLRARIKRAKNPYDHGNTAQSVVRILERVKLPNVQKVLTY